jgi:hypothetical protein
MGTIRSANESVPRSSFGELSDPNQALDEHVVGNVDLDPGRCACPGQVVPHLITTGLALSRTLLSHITSLASSTCRSMISVYASAFSMTDCPAAEHFVSS